MKSDYHRIIAGSWLSIPDNTQFGVVFIDNSPGGDARLAPFLAFIGRSDYLVVHDYHRENEEAISQHLVGVNFRVFRDYDPPTLLASKLGAEV